MVPVKEPSMIKSNVKREREIIRTESVFQYVCVYLSLSLSLRRFSGGLYKSLTSLAIRGL